MSIPQLSTDSCRNQKLAPLNVSALVAVSSIPDPCHHRKLLFEKRKVQEGNAVKTIYVNHGKMQDGPGKPQKLHLTGGQTISSGCFF